MSYGRTRTWLWSLLALLTLVLIGEILWSVRSGSRIAIRRIILESDLAISDGQLLEMLGISDGRFDSIQVSTLEEKLAAWPVVRSVKVTKLFPDSLKIELYRRKPLVAAFSESENGMTVVMFDNEGYIVKTGNVSRNENIPVLSGPTFGMPVLGARLPTFLQNILSNLGELQSLEPELYSRISELEILPNDTENYDLRLFLNTKTIPVIIDGKLAADTIRRAVLVGNILSSGAVGQIVEADIRGKSVVYRQMEENGDV